MKKDIMKLVKGMILTAMITVSAGSAFAVWTPAPSLPAFPGNNTPEPINVSDDVQGKGIAPNTYSGSLLNIKGTFSAEKMLVLFDAIINGQLTVGSLSQSNNSGLPWANGKEPVCATTAGTLVLCGSPVVSPLVVTLTANPTSVASGNTSTLTWTSSGGTGAISCVETANATGFSTGGAANGSDATIALSATTTYTVTCTDSLGVSSSASATVTVTSALYYNLVAYGLTSTPSVVTVGVPVTFNAFIKNNGAAGTPFGQNFANSFEIPFVGTLSPMSTLPPLASGAFLPITSPSYTFNVAGTYQIKSCADKNQQVQPESNEAWTDNCTTMSIVVSPAPMSDLVAGVVTHNPDPIYFQSGNNNPNPGTIDVTFSAVVTNQGNIATNNGAFRNIFQFAAGAGGLNPETTLIGANEALPATVGPLAPSATTTVTRTRTFYRSGGSAIFSPGTHSVRACADNNASWNDIVDNESSESNNCGPWKDFTIEMPDIVVAYAPSLYPNTILPGDEVAMTAMVFNIGGAPTCYPNTAGCFRNVFQWSTDPTFPVNSTNYVTTPQISLAPNSGATITTGSPGIEFNTAGTYYVRACGDNNSANGNSTGSVTTEASETNNCGLATVLTVGTYTLTANLTVSPSVGLTSQTFTLTATAGGNISGNPTYRFKCKSTDSWPVSYQSGNTFPCTYTTGGTYTPMVEIKRGSPFLLAQASTTANVVTAGVWIKDVAGTYAFTVGTTANCPTCNIQGPANAVIPVTMTVRGGQGGGARGGNGDGNGQGGGGGGGQGGTGITNTVVTNVTIPSSGHKTYNVVVGGGGYMGFDQGLGHGQPGVATTVSINPSGVFLTGSGGTGGMRGIYGSGSGGAGGAGGTLYGMNGDNGHDCLGGAGAGSVGAPGSGGRGGNAAGQFFGAGCPGSYNDGVQNGVSGNPGRVQFTW